MWDQFKEENFGVGLSTLVEALYEKNIAKMENAATLFETICDSGDTSYRFEPILRIFSAFAFEACGESPRSKKSYSRLFENFLPLDEAFGSIELCKMYSQSIAHYGMRNLESFQMLTNRFFHEINERMAHPKLIPEVSAKSDFLVSLAILDILLKYSEALQQKRKWTRLGTEIESLTDIVQNENVSSWLAILARLLCYTLGSVAERSILNLDLPETFKIKIANNRITELWVPQEEAVEKGLLHGRNIIYATETSTGKSLLAYLLSGTASINHKVVYIVPTRTLADEAYKTIINFIDQDAIPIAITTREKTEFDENLSDYAIIIATYEKFDGLIKQQRVSLTNIKSLIADEIQFISNRTRGIPLEFTLAEIKKQYGSCKPQIVALSAMINSEDAKQMSSWLQASLVKVNWKPVFLDEIILYNSRFYHKNGLVEELHPEIRSFYSDEQKSKQRMAILTRLIRDIILKKGQCMIVVGTRKDSEKVAQEIATFLESSSFFDFDSQKILSLNENDREKLRLEILNSEPELPICGQKLYRFMKYGVVYHHGGLPSKYRDLIETGVKKHLVSIIVTTTTFEAGVNLPLSNVIFLDISKGINIMPIKKYKNLAGRAGRPQYDLKGESIIITTTEEEFEKVKKIYFESEEEPLESSIQYFMKRQPGARYAIQSEILERASEHDSFNFEQIMNFMHHSWFWFKADESSREQFSKDINIELWKLKIFGFLEQTEKIYRLTESGRFAGRTMLNPLSIRNLIDNINIIFSREFDNKSLIILLLSLIGIPSEVEDCDEIIKRVKVADDCNFITQFLNQDPYLKEPEERIKLCPKYATVLWYWINSVPTEKILDLCNLDPSADSALLEELLPNNAYWILMTLASMPNSAIKMTENQRDLITSLATSAKFGSSNIIAQHLLANGLKYMGRNSAIKMIQYITENNMNISQLTENSLCELFNKNQVSAKLLYNELLAKGFL